MDSLDALRTLATTLGSVCEIAVDLEAHSYRSFQACSTLLMKHLHVFASPCLAGYDQPAHVRACYALLCNEDVIRTVKRCVVLGA